jgi:hypothetical protein
VGLSDLGSFSRTSRTSKYFELPNFLTPQIRVRIARTVESEDNLFLGKRIIVVSPATHIKLGATVRIASYHFSLLPSHLSLASHFTAPWLTPLSMTPAAPVAPSVNDDDFGHDSGVESTVMAVSSSLTRGTTKMADGEIPKLTDLFKKKIVTEDDRRAYHDRGWLTDNLVSFIPEVDVLTVEGSIILCFKSRLAAVSAP